MSDTETNTDTVERARVLSLIFNTPGILEATKAVLEAEWYYYKTAQKISIAFDMIEMSLGLFGYEGDVRRWRIPEGWGPVTPEIRRLHDELRAVGIPVGVDNGVSWGEIVGKLLAAQG